MLKGEDVATQLQLMYLYNTSKEFVCEHGELSIFDGGSVFDVSVNTEVLRQQYPRSLGYLGVGSGFTVQYEADDGPDSVDDPWPTMRFLWVPTEVDSPYTYHSVSIVSPPQGEILAASRHDEMRYVPGAALDEEPSYQQVEQNHRAFIESIELEAETGANLLNGQEVSALRGIIHGLRRQSRADLTAMKRPRVE